MLFVNNSKLEIKKIHISNLKKIYGIMTKNTQLRWREKIS